MTKWIHHVPTIEQTEDALHDPVARQEIDPEPELR